MHFMGFVVVDEPTDEAVKAAMEPHGEDGGRRWDWYRAGGRWDGHLQGPDEEKRRETHNGFNFAPQNDNAASNAIKVADYTGEAPYFFVSPEGDWVPKEYWNEWERRDDNLYWGRFDPTPHFDERWEALKRAYPDKFLVVVDAHN